MYQQLLTLNFDLHVNVYVTIFRQKGYQNYPIDSLKIKTNNIVDMS